MRLTQYKLLVNELMMVIPDQDKWKLKKLFGKLKELHIKGGINV